MIKIISFDLDGTLIDEKLDKIFWNTEIPRLYAEKYNLSFEEAKKVVFHEFLKIKKDEIIHIGNEKEHDYNVPKSIGIKCLLIDRTKKLKGSDIIHSLIEIKNYLE